VDVPEMIVLPGGTYEMGESAQDKFANSSERPRHRETIVSFLMSRTPVTEAQWAAFAGEEGVFSELPVVSVSWNEASAYTEWLAKTTGKPFRLPTEAEWEYGCRAGSREVFHTGGVLSTADANYLYNEQGDKVGVGRRLPVGSFLPNFFGLCDMHGNVSEWVGDAWRPDYASAPDPTRRTIRGGAWDHLPRLLRSAWRDWLLPDAKLDDLGFRVACAMTGSGGDVE
jgi:formylglycine-generating enzyme required for sulfatase activity